MRVQPIASLADPPARPVIEEAQGWLYVVWAACFRLGAPGEVTEAVVRAQEQIEVRGPVWMRREARKLRELGRRTLLKRPYPRDVGSSAGVRACAVAAWILTSCAAAIEREDRRARIAAGMKRWEREEG